MTRAQLILFEKQLLEIGSVLHIENTEEGVERYRRMMDESFFDETGEKFRSDYRAEYFRPASASPHYNFVIVVNPHEFEERWLKEFAMIPTPLGERSFGLIEVVIFE